MGHDVLLKLYAQMYLIRRTEEVVAELYAEQEMRCPVHLCIGQEAAAVGVCHALTRDDYVFGNHRSHGHYIAKGGNLPALIAEFYGRETGCSMGKGGSMHLIDLDCGFLGAAPILGATTSLAVGAAFGAKLRGEQRVTVAFLGDAACEEGIFYESANFAAVQQLPVIFACENNQLSVHSSLAVRQPRGRKLFEMVRGLGLKAAEGDGADVLEVLQLSQEAVQHARSGKGPVFLELHAYRWREHCGPNFDFNLGYRTDDREVWHRYHCPLARLKKHMIRTGVWNEQTIAALSADAARQVDAAVRFAKTSRFPDPEWLTRHEYAPDSPAAQPRSPAVARVA